MATWDEFLLLSKYPEINEKIDAIDHLETCGGPVLNALRFISAMGGSVFFGGFTGNDFRGKLIRNKLIKEGVGFPQGFCEEHSLASFAHIWVDQITGKRTVSAIDNSSFIISKEIQQAILSSKSMLIDNRHAGYKMPIVELAQKKGVKIFCDFGSLRPKSLELLPLVDDAILSKKFLSDCFPSLTLHEAMIEIINMGVETVAVTLGENGCIFTDNKKIILAKKAANVQNVVDETGAGDIFHGAWVYGKINNWKLEQVVSFASASAALQCTFLGTQVYRFTIENINSFITGENTVV